MTSKDPGAKTIVALDVGSASEALALVDRLRGLAGMFKIGSELFVSEGPDVVRAVVDRGERVFLDLKLHDIPNTVSAAALEAGRLGVSMLTVHGLGGPAMIAAARRRLEAELGAERPLIVAVTVLTSLDDRDLAETGVAGTAREAVLRLAAMAGRAGADGCVCSPEEVRAVRALMDDGFRIVTPGVRMPRQGADDQARTSTPRRAVADGADWIVIGRYVNKAVEPRQAMLEVIESLQSP